MERSYSLGEFVPEQPWCDHGSWRDQSRLSRGSQSWPENNYHCRGHQSLAGRFAEKAARSRPRWGAVMGTIEAPHLWRDIRSDSRVMRVSHLRLPSEKNRASTEALKVIRLALQDYAKAKNLRSFLGDLIPIPERHLCESKP